jgi:hypothetical protein
MIRAATIPMMILRMIPLMRSQLMIRLMMRQPATVLAMSPMTKTPPLMMRSTRLMMSPTMTALMMK